jgi:hypothetical protein
MFTRREFVRIVPALGAFAVSADIAAAQRPEAAEWPSTPPVEGMAYHEAFPHQHPFLVREIVAASHNNLGRVKGLVGRHQTLAKASWDQGFGDWETALGAASHVGNRPIAEFLIAQGAPPTIFSAAMLGQLSVVKAFAAAIPNVNQLRGPHGIPLINHARAGGAPAAGVFQFLEALGNLPQTGDLQSLSAADRASLEGRYVYGDGPRDEFIIDVVKNTIGITRAGSTRRLLVHVGKLEFQPVGAPSVHIRFERSAGHMSMSVFDPDLVVRAIRTP